MLVEYYDHLCACGCGGRIPIRSWHNNEEPPKFLHGHNRRRSILSEEDLKGCRERVSGDRNPMKKSEVSQKFRHPRSPEVCKKIGDGNRGKVRSPEIVEKNSHSHKGKKLKPHTTEARKKIGDANRGTKHSEVFCKGCKERQERLWQDPEYVGL